MTSVDSGIGNRFLSTRNRTVLSRIYFRIWNPNAFVRLAQRERQVRHFASGSLAPGKNKIFKIVPTKNEVSLILSKGVWNCGFRKCPSRFYLPGSSETLCGHDLRTQNRNLYRGILKVLNIRNRSYFSKLSDLCIATIYCEFKLNISNHVNLQVYQKIR